MADRLLTLEDLHVRYHCGKVNGASIENQDETKPTPVQISAATKAICDLYDAGTPIYSKHAMRDVSRQIQSEHQWTISVRAIDERVVLFDRETGQPWYLDDGSGCDWIIGHPEVLFMSIQDILEHAHEYPSPLSLCSMWISHYTLKRRKQTGEIVYRKSNQSIDQVRQSFEENRRAWEATEHHSQICTILKNAVLAPVTKIVAFACGSMAFSDVAPWSFRSAYQHSLILTVRGIINARSDQVEKVRCFVQDPAYCDHDIEVLSLHDVTVLDSPEGFIEVDDTAIVLSFAPDVAVRQIIADIARPAMMIWDRGQPPTADSVEEIGKLIATNVSAREAQREIDINAGADSDGVDYVDPVIISTDPDSPRLTRMLEHFYDEVDFPGDLEAFKGLAVYVRET